MDRWMLRTAGWKGCNEEPADDMKCDYGFCTETRSAWRRSMAAREEHDVEGDERRHDRAKTSLARFNVGKCHGFTNSRLTFLSTLA